MRTIVGLHFKFSQFVSLLLLHRKTVHPLRRRGRSILLYGKDRKGWVAGAKI